MRTRQQSKNIDILNLAIPEIERVLIISREDARGLGAFLFSLANTTLKGGLSPSLKLDQLWHALLLHPLAYQTICQIFSDRIVDHHPENSADSLSEKRKRRQRAICAITSCLGLDYVHASFHHIHISVFGDQPQNTKHDILIHVNSTANDLPTMDEYGPNFERVFFACDGESGNQKWVDMTRPLWEYGVDDGSILFQKRSYKYKCSHIFIKTPSGNTLTLYVEADELVESVKCKIRAKENILPGFDRLIFAGRQLEDAKTLGDYSVVNDSTLHLVGRLFGC